MKCIKNKVTNEIERVNNETAHNRVNSGKWVYCPKHEYKSFVKALNDDKELPAQNNPIE